MYSKVNVYPESIFYNFVLNPKQSRESVEIALFVPNSMEVLGCIVDWYLA